MMEEKKTIQSRVNQFSGGNLPGKLCLENVKKIKTIKSRRVPLWKESAHILSNLFWLLQRMLRAVSFRLAVKTMKGYEKHSGQPIRVGYIGDQSNLHYIIGLLFQISPDITDHGKIRCWRLKSLIAVISSEVDLMILDLDFPLTAAIRLQGFLKMPRWVKQRVPIADTWDEVLAGLRRKTRREALRLIRKFNFSAYAISGRDSAAYFYDRLYIPHIIERFGKAASIVKRERFMKECRRTEIIHLVQENKILGGVVVRRAGNQLSVVWAGMETNLKEEERQGVTDALDLFSLLYAYEQGCKFLDMGPSRACLNDGLLRYKRKWGAAIYRNKIPQGDLLVSPITFGPAIASVLKHNKMITQENGSLVSRILFSEEFNVDELDLVVGNEWVEGLKKMKIFIHGPVPEGETIQKKQVEVVSYGTSHNLLKDFTKEIAL